jgi:HAE1 family hydrophobic/amphiphilic exporter-1
MITSFFIVLGVLALKKLPVDLYPDVSYPMLSVRANLAGAAPEEMEQLVSKPIEDALSSLAGLKSIRSISRESMTIVTMEFESGIDIKFQEMQVRAKVANMRNTLPDSISEPVVERQDPDDTPIIEIAVTGNRSASELGKMVEDRIADRIRQVAGVGAVSLGGNRQREIHVELKPEVIEARRITSASVVQAIRDFNGSDPIGKLDGNRSVWLLRSTAHIEGVANLREIPVGRTSHGDPILLSDVADVSDGFAEMSSIGRFNDGQELRPAIALDVMKQSGENTVAVSDNVLALLRTLRKELPTDISISVTRDNADLVRTNVADVLESLLLGAFLTMAVVLIFLRSPRATLTTGISLPSSVITTFAVMAVAGFTINVMTLMALSLAIGLLVDDAIVVRENIFRHLQDPTVKATEASYRGAREVSLAVVATTLTIVAVFLPVGFMSGTTGQFFKQFAVTVIFAVMISLWDALTMAPMLSAYFANFPDPTKEWLALGRIGRFINKILERFEHSFFQLEQRYGRILAWLLPRPWVALGASVLTVATAVWGFQVIGKSFLPAQLGNVFSVSLNGPQAVAMGQVTAMAKKVDERIQRVNGLENWTIRTGGTWGNANIRLTIRVKDNFAANQDALAKVRTDVRTSLEGLVGYRVRVSEPSDPLAGSTGRFQPVAVLVSGAEQQTLTDIARRVQGIMGEVKGITDVSPLQDEGVPELLIETSPKLAGHFGVTSKAIGSELRAWIEGDTSNHIRIGDDRIPIRVRLRDGQKLTPASLMAKSILGKGKSGEIVAVPIASTSTIKAGAGPAMISRENRQKILRVGANIERGTPLGTIVNDLEAQLATLAMPDGYQVKIVGQSEQMSELFHNVMLALGLGCLFMYMILASLFESFLQPLTVMAAVPLAATGAVLALLAFGLPLDLYGGIGMILLAGIVAKNSILLVDFAMQRVRELGNDPMTAILESAPLRLRPILMTSSAMIVGMLPVATGMGVGGAARQTLGIATIGGIISSTLLTLVIVPNLYVMVERSIRRKQTHKGKSTS